MVFVLVQQIYAWVENFTNKILPLSVLVIGIECLVQQVIKIELNLQSVFLPNSHNHNLFGGKT